MQAYRHLEPEELALDASFQRWQLHNDPVDDAFWQEWLSQNRDKQELIDKAAYLLTTLHTIYGQQFTERLPISTPEIQAEISRLHQSLDRPRGSIKWFYSAPVRYGMAASVVLLLGLFGWYGWPSSSEKNGLTYHELVAHVTEPLAEVTNTTSKPLLVNLPDKSTILLYPRSRVAYSKQFVGVKREVYLSGKAFFEVFRNPSRPFYVYADNLVTKVLGTSFFVQTDETTKQVKVVVKTGKVSVYTQSRASSASPKEEYKLGGTVLTPNQQVVFSTEGTRLVRSLVEQPALVEKTAQKQSFVFKRTPIAEVFAALEQAYSIRIIFDEELMKDCYLTASLSDEPLFDKLDLICHTINARYDQLDGYVVMNSKGCK